MLARLFLAFVLLLPVSAAAQAPATAPAPRATPPATAAPAPTRMAFGLQMLAGSWVLRVEDAVVFRFDLARSGDGWSGTWIKPKSFATDGAAFAELSGPPAEQKAQSGRTIGDWVELTFGDTRPGAIPDVFRFRLLGPDRAEMLYTDTGQAPYTLERAEAGTAPGPWAAGRVYRRAGVEPGTLVSYNVAARTAPSPRPTPAATETGRPPAIIGR